MNAKQQKDGPADLAGPGGAAGSADRVPGPGGDSLLDAAGIPQYPGFWLLYAVAAVAASGLGLALLPVIRRYEDWLRRLEDRHQAVPVPYIQRHRRGA